MSWCSYLSRFHFCSPNFSWLWPVCYTTSFLCRNVLYKHNFIHIWIVTCCIATVHVRLVISIPPLDCNFVNKGLPFHVFCSPLSSTLFRTWVILHWISSFTYFLWTDIFLQDMWYCTLDQSFRKSAALVSSFEQIFEFFLKLCDTAHSTHCFKAWNSINSTLRLWIFLAIQYSSPNPCFFVMQFMSATLWQEHIQWTLHPLSSDISNYCLESIFFSVVLICNHRQESFTPAWSPDTSFYQTPLWKPVFETLTHSDYPAILVVRLWHSDSYSGAPISVLWLIVVVMFSMCTLLVKHDIMHLTNWRE